jgi:GntR family phosphonate transport system transcriptional regulator
MTTLTSSASSFATPARDSFWLRIAAQISDAISCGTYPPGERLPSEHALAEQFGVNRHTIRKSLASLSSQGLVRVTQGSGTYVEDFAVELMLGKRTRHRHSLVQAGLRGGLQVLEASTVRANSAQAKALALPARSKLLCLNVLGEAEGQILHVSERYFPLPRFTGLDTLIADTGSITAAFATCGLTDYTRQESRITAQIPSTAIAAHLRQPVSRPVLEVTSVNVDSTGTPIEFATTWFAGDRVKLTIRHDD